MSALRVSRPGLPTRLVILDDGARPMGRRYIGGSLVTAAPPVRRRAVPPAAVHDRAKATCGLLMRNTQARCARMPEHKDACRTATWMQGQAMERRTT